MLRNNVKHVQGLSLLVARASVWPKKYRL